MISKDKSLATYGPTDFLVGWLFSRTGVAQKYNDTIVQCVRVEISQAITEKRERFLLRNRRGERGVNEAVQGNALLFS